MNIAIGSDHGGFKMKEMIRNLLVELGHVPHDVGCFSTDSVDYPDIAKLLADEVISERCPQGILVCGSGIGMSIAINRDPRIRAALCHDEYTARMSREHNDANVLCLGERVLGFGVTEGIVGAWLATSFAGGRHQRRIDKMSK